MADVSRAALAIGMGALVLIAPVAHAALTLTISDGSTTLTVVDGAASDPDAMEDNIIMFGSSVGSFTANFTVATSKSPSGQPTVLGLTDVSISGDGELTIRAFDNEFDATTLTQANLMASQTLTSGAVGFIDYSAGFNGVGELSVGPLFGNTAGSDTAIVDLSSEYTAFLEATITRTAADPITQFNAALTVVPLPASALLLLSGLGGLGFVARRRREVAA